MNSAKRCEILAMAHIEYEGYSTTELNEEHKRKLLNNELNMFGHVLSRPELFALFEILISEKK